jgi:hypothetical protein
VNHRARLVPVAFALVAALGTALAPERPGYSLNGDVTAYLGSAKSLVEDGRLRHPIGTIFDETTDAPLAHWPPGYPLALAVPIALGASPPLAARIVRVISAFVAVLTVLLLVTSLAGPGAAAIAGALVLATPSIVGVQLSPLSEAFFAALVVLLVHAMLKWPDRPLRYGLLAAAVVLTRYVGVAFAATACGWALLQPGSLGRRLGRAVVAGLPTLVTQLAWLAWTRHVSGNVRNVGVQAPFGETVRKLAGAVTRWLAPAMPDGPLVPLVKLASLLAIAGLVVWAALRLRREWYATGSAPARGFLSLVAITGTFTVIYYAVYVLARLFADYALDFHPRYWAPLELLYAAILAIALATWWRGGRPRLGAVAALVVAVWFAASLAASVALVREARAEERANAATMADSRLLAWVREEASGRALFSNWGAVLWRYAGRSSRELPIVDDPALDSLLARRVRESDGLLVNFTARDPVWMLPPGGRYVDPDTLAARLGMREVARFREGVVYGTDGAGVAAPLSGSDR